MTPTLSATADHLEVIPNSTEGSPLLRGIPLTMPSDQEYYWCHEWQSVERQALAELDAGEGVRFDSDDPEDVVRWLHEADDDE